MYIVCIRKDLNFEPFEFPLPKYTQIVLDDILETKVESRYFINREDIKLHKKKKIESIVPSASLEPIRFGTIGKGGQGERIYSTKGHAITLSAYGGGAASKTGAYLINHQHVRKLTPRECARVMGFPESFKIPVTDTQAYKQFGNSVSVPVLKAISAKIVSYL